MTEQAFRFGRNWRSFLDNYLTRERIELAKQSLLEFSGLPDLKGQSFIDVGCGSGLFSLAALELGAAKIVSLDADEDSVSCCKALHEKQGKPESWRVVHGSILDDLFVRSLGRHSFVYSWGVLHHTGKLWRAIENASLLVEPNGLLYISIYNRADGFALYDDGRFGPSRMWLRIKQIYSRLPRFAQSLVDYNVMLLLIAEYLVMLKNPAKQIRNHTKQYRGMAWRTDITDWLGGYPYEYASADEVFNFVKALGFELENLKSTNSLKNNEFLFRAPVSPPRTL